MPPRKKSLTLPDWIVLTGIDNVAKLLKVDRSAVSLWKYRATIPRPKHMYRIVKLTEGAVSYAEMVESFVTAPRGR